MADNLKPEDRRRTMQAVKGKGTKLERRLFAILIRMKLSGWKKNVASLPGKPDVVFEQKKVVIFVDGCFWHGCPRCRRTLPETNNEYWVNKIQRNIALAKTHNRKLRKDGWIVIRVWEHELRQTTDVVKVKTKILRAVNNKE